MEDHSNCMNRTHKQSHMNSEREQYCMDNAAWTMSFERALWKKRKGKYTGKKKT